jgi:AP-2 complex subunit alpha
MKGLQQFISDLRASTKDQEHQRINHELVNIKRQFSTGPSGYQRKKYCAKLIYIYLTTGCVLDLSFGDEQFAQLTSSNVYSEKFIGYLGAGLMDIDIDYNLVKNDLLSNNQEFNALALHYVAQSEGYDLTDVFQLLRSPTSTPLIKKKAALALLHLLRRSHTPLKTHWTERILILSDDPDLGVLLASIPLIEHITMTDKALVQRIIPTLTKRLHTIINKEIPSEYIYNGIPSPWLIVKLSHILTILIPEYDIDLNTLRTLRECVSTVINTIGAHHSSDQTMKNSILFSIIELAIYLDPSPEALDSSIDSMIRLLSSKDINTKYLALGALITLSGKHAQKYISQILDLLSGHDISISKRALELIYNITDSSTLEYTVAELFKVLKTSDMTMKYEIGIKISILLEKYATDAQWFVEQMLHLIDTTGDDSIWIRLVQIVVNNEDLQQFACLEVMKYAQKDGFKESIVKISAIILGEYGDRISEKLSIMKQFNMVLGLYFYVSNETRAIMLITMMKLFTYDDTNTKLKSKLIKVLKMELQSINSELQQRSLELLNLVQKYNENRELVTFVLSEMPAYNSLDNPLLKKFNKRMNKGITVDTLKNDVNGMKVSNGDSHEAIKRDTPLTPNWRDGYLRLFEFQQGVFYENSLIKILLRIQQDEAKHLCIYQFNVMNKSPGDINSFHIQLVNYRTVKPNVVINITDFPQSDILINGRAGFKMEVLLRSPFEKQDIPNFKIQFQSGGGFNNLKLKLPIFMTKFLTSSEMGIPLFIQRWKQMEIIPQASTTFNKEIDRDWFIRLLNKLGFGVTQHGDFLFVNGILHTFTSGKFGLLMKLKMGEIIEVSIRATKEGIAPIFLEYLVDFL